MSLVNQQPPSLEPYFFRDLANGIQQQMYFWGQDVQRPEGNFLVKQGFERSPSLGLPGTSRYRLPWKGGTIELYGSCAGWYGPESGFTFIRSRGHCDIWLSGEETPIPGAWQTHLLAKEASREELYEASLTFLDWLITYEHAVLEEFVKHYREANYRRYKKVPKARQWIRPEAALSWFECFCQSPEKLVRPKKLAFDVDA